MAQAGPAVAAPVPNFIDNFDRNYLIDITAVIRADPVNDTACDIDDAQGPLLFDDARGDNDHDLAVLSDDVPSSQGTPTIGIPSSAFDLINHILDNCIRPYNGDTGPFRDIQKMIHSLFYSLGSAGFVGFTPAGVLSEYTATIYYAATNSYTNSYTRYQNIIQIILHHIPDPITDPQRNITFAFKLDKGVKPGDTIKLILSVTFGTGVGANVILIPILNIVGFNLSSTIGAPPQPVTGIQDFTRFYSLPGNLLPIEVLPTGGSFPIFDLIAKLRLCANMEGFGALIEPTDAEKILMQEFFNGIDLRAFILFIKFAFYTDEDKNFALFLNIFFNFYKVSVNVDPVMSRSTAKIMYTDFFTRDNNYGSIIRIFNNMMSFPLFNQHTIMFLSGSNAVRPYKVIEEFLNMDITLMTLEQIQAEKIRIYDTHMTTLSDTDIMFYLLNEDSEPHRLAIRMMLGACLYYLKNILSPAERQEYTDLLEQSISIVGHNDHLFAQRLNANEVFLRRCFDMPHLLGETITDILAYCGLPGFNFYPILSGNVGLPYLDLVFKHNTAESWYISVFLIFGVNINPLDHGHIELLRFLTTKAMAVNCIATPWTLILNILYTIFVTENCVARIVVGKLGNDPKNLEKYFSILNTHLRDLNTQYTNTRQQLVDKQQELRQQELRQGRLKQVIEDRPRERDDQGGGVRKTDTSRDTSRGDDPDINSRAEIEIDIGIEIATFTEKIALHDTILDDIRIITELQTTIIRQSTTCQEPVTHDNPATISERYNTLKELCRSWVQHMYTLALNPLKKELFFLSDAYPFIIRKATLLEKGICCAWSVDSNICNRDAFLAGFNPLAITVDNFQPVYTEGNLSEQTMHRIVPQLQTIIMEAVATALTFNVTPNHPLLGHQSQVNHYDYMNHLWKHLTNTSINLRSMFKSDVKDLKRIVGSKYFTAISLLGAYPCGLLIDELKESKNTNLTDDRLDALKNRDDILNCRRGLLPLLVPELPQHSAVFATMIVRLLYIDFHPTRSFSTETLVIFLGFLFSIRIKSNASIGPRNMLSLVDSIINFGDIPNHNLLLPYTGNPATAGNCSLSNLSLHPDTETCATRGVEHTGGGGKKPTNPPTNPLPIPPQKPTSKVPVKGVSKLTTPSVAQGLTLQELSNPKLTTKKVKALATLAAAAVVALKSPKATALEKKADVQKIPYLKQLLNPPSGPFKKFMDKIREVIPPEIAFNPKTCITGITRQDVYNIDRTYNDNDRYRHLRISVGGSNKKNNKTKSNNKISKTNNHTRKNKYKRNNKNKKHKSSPKYRKVVPSSRSGSQSNRKKSKSKLPHKNVTFKRRRARK